MLPCVWFSNRSQKTSKCSKNITDTLGDASCATFFVLTTLRRHLWSITESDARQHGIYLFLYNNPSYSRILISSCLWSIRGQMHDWRHHYRAFASAVLKWRKVLRIRIIFYVTRQKIRYKKFLQRHWTGSRSQEAKDNFLAVSVGSRARRNCAKVLQDLVTVGSWFHMWAIMYK